MSAYLPVPDAAYVGECSRSRQFLPPEYGEASQNAFCDLTRNFDLYASIPGKCEQIGTSLQAQFAGIGIMGGTDVGFAPIVDGAAAPSIALNEPGQGKGNSLA